MHAVVVRLTIDDVHRDDQLLAEQVVPLAVEGVEVREVVASA